MRIFKKKSGLSRIRSTKNKSFSEMYNAGRQRDRNRMVKPKNKPIRGV